MTHRPLSALALGLTSLACSSPCPSDPVDGACSAGCPQEVRGLAFDAARSCIGGASALLLCEDLAGQTDDEACIARVADGVVFLVGSSSYRFEENARFRACTPGEAQASSAAGTCP